MDHYEEQKLKLTKKTESLEKKLKSLVDQIEEEQREIPEPVTQASTLDKVW